MNLRLLQIINNVFLILVIFNLEILCPQEIHEQGFADYLYKEGEYYRAITEYYRISYMYRDSTKKAELFRNIGLCYFHGADYQGYISFLKKKCLYFELNAIVRTEMDLYLGKCYYYLNQYSKAINTLEWNNISPENIFFNEKQLLLGIFYARTFDWKTAIKKMQLIEQDSPQKLVAENFSRSLKNFSNLPRRSPFWAGFSSTIIPGSGYIYCNRIGTGITSLIINGLLVWTISDAIRQEQYGLATLAGFLGIGWYIGNIKGSAEAAHIYNSNIRNKFIDRLLEKEGIDKYLRN